MNICVGDVCEDVLRGTVACLFYLLNRKTEAVIQIFLLQLVQILIVLFIEKSAAVCRWFISYTILCACIYTGNVISLYCH